jgi:hypothetical protein
MVKLKVEIHKRSAFLGVAAVVLGFVAGTRSASCVRSDARQACGRDCGQPSATPVTESEDPEAFVGAYQTLIAIIQGVAFGALVVSSPHEIFTEGILVNRLTAAAQAIATLVALILVTDEYFQLVRAARWSPTVIDTAIPYLLGCGEVVAAVSVGKNERWWAAISVLLFFGVAAFTYSNIKASSAYFPAGEDGYRWFIKVVKGFTIACMIALIFSVCMILLASDKISQTWLLAAAPLLLLVGFYSSLWLGTRLLNRLTL